MTTRQPPTAPPRRVVFVHERPDGLGGSQHSMLAEAEALADAGWEVLIVHGQDDELATLGPYTAELRDPGLFLQHRSPRSRRAIKRLATFLAAERPAVAHLHLWSSPMLLGFLVGRLPTVATCHVPVCPNGARFHYAQERICEHAVGLYCLGEGYRHHGCATTSDEHRYGLPAFVGALAYAKQTLQLLARCQRVIAPSSWQRRKLVADGIPADRVVVLPPIVTPAIQLTATRDREGPPIVLAVGRLTVLKGMHHLLQASARVDAPHQIRIAGEGPALSALKALTSQLGIADHTRFLGPLGEDSLARAFAGASVVVMPSLCPETFGMVGPEALLAGTPVIVYEGGGVSDWALTEHGVRTVAAGDIAELAGAIEAAIDAPYRVGPTATTAVRDAFSPERHTAALLRVYEQLSAS